MPELTADVPQDLLTEVAAVSNLLEEDRERTVERALREGLTRLRVQTAVHRYQNDEISIAAAADIADCSVADWLEIANERNLTTHLDVADLADDAARATQR
ncbi:UPF0175 family protein [Halococcoides cellulosivorans]|uniref:Uncharacterized protein n=1 Tax=Halococcoides cellulosivorans TaxID=1679096 RepID=A0A2R4X2E4_9EURY|nr:UPF0175 family protein [Halococcoides cellulosivorans]AWB27952.1 hypothetical protein HARCEL1_09640 [Halococcoides cellulosivorans]